MVCVMWCEGVSYVMVVMCGVSYVMVVMCGVSYMRV